MGKVNFTSLQRKIFDSFSKTELSKHFYFTGGTALSVFYLNHRYSEDLDFFSQTDFDDNIIIDFMNKVASTIGGDFNFTKIGNARIFEFRKAEKLLVKVDFAYYPFKRLKIEKIYQGVSIDSIVDIAVNKLLTINQRTNVKDYVDLYFLLKKFTIWDLLYGVEAKFRMKIDLILLTADFLKVEDFEVMPKMITKLKLTDLKDFFKEKAIKLGREFTK